MSKLIIGNWKSHKTTAEAGAWLDQYHALIGPKSKVGIEVILAPPFPLLPLVQAHSSKLGLDLTLAAQDLSSFPPGSYTGAVVAENMQDFGVQFAIVGHSERRRYFHESHQDVANKVTQAIQHNLTPIVCIDDEYIVAQASAIEPSLYGRCVIAYEPLEAIGNGHSQPVEEVVPVVKKIKEVFGPVKVIYGGSVSAATVHEYLEVCHGVLVGRDSLAASDFAALVKAA